MQVFLLAFFASLIGVFWGLFLGERRFNKNWTKNADEINPLFYKGRFYKVFDIENLKGCELMHTNSKECWCEPECVYVDPETGAKLWVHKERQ